MSETDDLKSPRRRDLMAEIVAVAPEVEIETARDGFLYVRFAGTVPVRFYYYPYRSVESSKPFETSGAGRLDVASLIDLALMKLGAIISRGTRRDFVDLYMIGQRISIEDVFAASNQKFPRVRDFQLQALKGLADLSIATRDPMPRLTINIPWSAVTDWLDGTVRDAARRSVGLPSIMDASGRS